MSVDLNILQQLIDARITQQALDAKAIPVDMSIEQAYLCQTQLIRQYTQQAKTQQTGWKVALSGKAAQAKYGLQYPVYGHLCADMQVENGSKLELKQLYQPKLEIELAFTLKEAIAEIALTDAELLDKVEHIRPAIEIADTRWLNWQCNLGQFLMDNSAARAYILGDISNASVYTLDIQHILEHSSVELTVTTQPEDQPIHNYLWLVRKLLAQGKRLEAGDVILTGSVIRPLELQKGNYQFQVLGQKLAFNVI